MEINFDTATGHARALAHNHRAAHPDASDSALADYVAEHMVAFMKRARNAHRIAKDYDAWYAHSMLNFGGTK